MKEPLKCFCYDNISSYDVLLAFYGLCWLYVYNEIPGFCFLTLPFLRRFVGFLCTMLAFMCTLKWVLFDFSCEVLLAFCALCWLLHVH